MAARRWGANETKSVQSDAYMGWHDGLRAIVAKRRYKHIFVFMPGCSWDVPVFQRPQQMALHMAQEDCLVFYCQYQNRYDARYGFQEIAENLYLTDKYDLLRRMNEKAVYVIYSTDYWSCYDEWEDLIINGNVVICDYIDEVHEDLYAENLPGGCLEMLKQKNERIFGDERFYVTATAQRLYDAVAARRKKNMALITNGVDYEHFQNRETRGDVPERMRMVVSRGKKIIGYFGAFASWFDYDLVMTLAHERQEYELVLIGVDYDGSMARYDLDRLQNITVLGHVNYAELPDHARWFNVSMIPFMVNEITLSTSPIKLFEYMALGHPIVTTALPECERYESVLVGRNDSEFVQKIDEAIKLEYEGDYLRLLRKDALRNTWGRKARDMLRMIGQ